MADLPALDAWLATIEHALIYPSSVFTAFLAEVTGAEVEYLAARRGAALCGVLPFAVRRSALGCAVNSLPWYGTHGGTWLADTRDAVARRALLEAYACEIERLEPMFVTTILAPDEQAHVADYAAALGHPALDDRIGQVLTLPDEADDPDAALLGAMGQKTRNLVRKALRQGFEERVGDDDDAWAFLEDTHVENLRALGSRPKPPQHFAAMRAHFGQRHARLSVAYDAGQPVAALLLLKFARTVEYFVPVVKTAARARQPLSFLIWQAMRTAMAEGYRYWNWGGTWRSQHSLHHFKAGWGSQDRPYDYLVGASAAGLDLLRRDAAAAFDAFPGFYLYPLDRLA